MLATEILTQDHREVETMIEQLEDIEEGSTTGRATFEQLRNALAMHMRAEEEIYYPALARHEEFSDIMEDSVSEHEGVKENLMQMNELAPWSDEFQELLTEVKAAIEMHVTKEEDDIFPESIDVLGRDNIETLGEEIDALKGDAGMSRTARM